MCAENRFGFNIYLLPTPSSAIFDSIVEGFEVLSVVMVFLGLCRSAKEESPFLLIFPLQVEFNTLAILGSGDDIDFNNASVTGSLDRKNNWRLQTFLCSFPGSCVKEEINEEHNFFEQIGGNFSVKLSY